MTDEFLAEHPDVPMSFILILIEDNLGDPPTGDTAANYWDHIDSPPDIPVTADPPAAVLEAVPYEDPGSVPGKCVLTPEMEIVDCYLGHGHEQAFEWILEDAGSQG